MLSAPILRLHDPCNGTRLRLPSLVPSERVRGAEMTERRTPSHPPPEVFQPGRPLAYAAPSGIPPEGPPEGPPDGPRPGARTVDQSLPTKPRLFFKPRTRHAHMGQFALTKTKERPYHPARRGNILSTLLSFSVPPGPAHSADPAGCRAELSGWFTPLVALGERSTPFAGALRHPLFQDLAMDRASHG